jgi:hypothetical protein
MDLARKLKGQYEEREERALGLTRQDADTDMTELLGLTCEQLVVVPADGEILVFYARIDGGWHRFYLEAGLLFWREGSRPDSEEDLDSEESYSDLSAELNMTGASFITLGFHEGFLELALSNGARIVCSEGKRGAKVVEKVRGRIGVPMRSVVGK